VVLAAAAAARVAVVVVVVVVVLLLLMVVVVVLTEVVAVIDVVVLLLLLQLLMVVAVAAAVVVVYIPFISFTTNARTLLSVCQRLSCSLSCCHAVPCMDVGNIKVHTERCARCRQSPVRQRAISRQWAWESIEHAGVAGRRC
jgi:hypothetical protein